MTSLIWIVQIIVGRKFAVSVLLWPLFAGFNAQAGDFVHVPSGITFPGKTERRFTLGPIEDGAATKETVSFYYLFPDGHRVIVKVHPAPKDARGPTKLDGDSRSDASPAFMKEFEALKNEVLKKSDSIAITGQMRFQAAPQRGGVLGMKVKLVGPVEITDMLLFERNGYFVKISATSPKEDNIYYGLTYTDVAHFINWPAK